MSSIQSAVEWIESTRLSIAIREGAFPYPILGGIHLLSIAIFGGMILITDLRLLGWAMRRYPVSGLIRGFRPWKWLGFFLIVSTGLFLSWAEPMRLYSNSAFLVKMGLLGLVGLHAAIFRSRVYRYPEKLDATVTRDAKLAAALSLILWAGLVIFGRLIAFDAAFDR